MIQEGNGGKHRKIQKEGKEELKNISVLTGGIEKGAT